MAKVTELKNALRANYIEMLKNFLEEAGEDIYITGTNEISFPVCDAEGNERAITIVVKVPAGSYETFNGVKTLMPYDVYAAANNFAIEQAVKEEKAKEKAAAKARKIEQDKIKREKLAEIKAKKEAKEAE